MLGDERGPEQDVEVAITVSSVEPGSGTTAGDPYHPVRWRGVRVPGAPLGPFQVWKAGSATLRAGEQDLTCTLPA